MNYRKFFGGLLISLLGVVILLVLAVTMYFKLAPQIGAKSKGKRLERILASPNYNDGKFQNTVKTDMALSMGALASIAWDYFTGENNREPESTIEVVPFEPASFSALPEQEVAISWFGHSSLLIRVDGKVLLTDPVFSPRASMFTFMGPERFDYTRHMSVDQLPAVDAILLSHDHYDHLDYETIMELKDRVKHFYAPLGVGAHLEEWGVPAKAITELDWWDSTEHHGLGLTLTPTRHFSGRGFTRFETLWGSWVIEGRKQKVFFNGDSGYFPGFKEIGDKYGPFDITLMECGAYNEQWAEIHMMPEETVQAHVDLKGKVLLPIHWGKFNLSLHPWKEPVERMTKKAAELGVRVCTPEVGYVVCVGSNVPSSRWWEKYD